MDQLLVGGEGTGALEVFFFSHLDIYDASAFKKIYFLQFLFVFGYVWIWIFKNIYTLFSKVQFTCLPMKKKYKKKELVRVDVCQVSMEIRIWCF